MACPWRAGCHCGGSGDPEVDTAMPECADPGPLSCARLPLGCCWAPGLVALGWRCCVECHSTCVEPRKMLTWVGSRNASTVYAHMRVRTHTHTHTLEPRNISPDAGRILKSALHRDLNSKCTMTSCFQKYLGRYAHVLKGSGRQCRALET